MSELRFLVKVRKEMRIQKKYEEIIILKQPKNCNCQNAVICPLNRNCLIESLVYRPKVDTINGQDKVYIGFRIERSKRKYYNDNSYFLQARYRSNTQLANYLKGKKNKRSVIYIENKMFKLWQEEELSIMLYIGQHNLLNQNSEIITASKHARKFLLANYDPGWGYLHKI